MFTCIQINSCMGLFTKILNFIRLSLDEPALSQALVSLPSFDTFSDISPNNSLNLDTERPRESLDDTYRPTSIDGTLFLLNSLRFYGCWLSNLCI